MKAARDGNADCVKALMAVGSAMNARDNFGYTAVKVAAAHGHADCAKALIAAGAHVDEKDDGWNKLMLAVIAGDADRLQTLVAAGADVNAKWEGNTALMFVAKQGDPDCLKVLIAAGADVNAKGHGGETALMLAAEKNQTDRVKALIAAGADVNAKNSNAWTALKFASFRGPDTDCFRALVAAGAHYRFFECSRPSGDGTCSDNGCPCGWPGAILPRGTGYLYVSKEVVDFREDACTEAEATAKIMSLQKRSGVVIANPNSLASAILICKQAALKRGVDLDIASQDARHWWETGEVPLRPTPSVAGHP
jgi:ankyrin repeat protein